MKRTHFFSFTLILAALFVMSAVEASAQGSIAPSSQFGVGVNVGEGVGAKIQYAISPAFHVGGGLNFATTDGNSQTGLEAYVRFLLEGTVNPIIQAGFASVSSSTDIGGGSVSTTTSGLYGGIGIQYFVNRNVGMYGLVNIIEAQLDPSATTIGIFSPRMGLEWFFR